MKSQLWVLLLLFAALGISGAEVNKVEKIEKYMGSCEIVNSALMAHLTYISETGYDDGYSNKGVIVEFANEKGWLVSWDKNVKRLAFSGFEKEVKTKNRMTRFSVEKDGNLFGGAEGELKIHKVKKTGSIDYEYKCYRGENCGEYEVELKLKNCRVDFKLKGKKIK